MLRRSLQTFTRLLDASDSATESRLAHNRPFGATTSRRCAMSAFQSLSYPARPSAGTNEIEHEKTEVTEVFIAIPDFNLKVK
jgi:hypothetical protein